VIGIPPGKADLAAVSVPAQQRIEVGNGCLRINFWRVREQNRQLVTRYPGSSFLNIIGAVKMRVVDLGETYALIVPLD
jgi:hypothetical protein